MIAGDRAEEAKPKLTPHEAAKQALAAKVGV